MNEAAVKIDGNIEATKALIEKQPEIKDAPKWLRNRQRTELVRKPDGQVWKEPVIDITDRRARAAVWEMIAPSIDAEMAHKRKLQMQIPTITAVTPRGERREIAAYRETELGKKGFRPATYYGKSRLRIERWSDGLLYRERPEGDFEPMGVCCIGTPVIPCKHPACERCR